jgi:uncharacterized protein (TIGR00299 family) protein
MYIECVSGVAGDMLLGALIDAGLPADALRRALGTLAVDHEIAVTRVLRAGVSSLKLDVREHGPGPSHTHTHEHTHEHEHSHEPTDDRAHAHGHTHQHGASPDHDPGVSSGHEHAHRHAREHGHAHEHEHGHAHPHTHGHRSLAEIRHLIGHSSLSAAGKARAIALFGRLAEAEAAIHQMSVDDIHLHEVGAVDSIIDIVGVVFAMEWFGIEDVVASPLNVGGGTVRIAHGTFPVPAPATLRLLRGVPVHSAGPQVELVTPTGALLVSGYARAYGPMPAMTVDRAGYGAGTREFADIPNVVRVVLGERVAPSATAEAGGPDTSRDHVVEIRCEIDDMNPQVFGAATDRLFDAGALDVFLTAVQMKKGRPGTLVTVLAPEALRDRLCDILFEETTTIGVRFQRMARETLDRRIVEVVTAGGPVRIKVSGRHGRTLTAVPEFDDCERIARATHRPVRDVQADALRAWWATGQSL